MNHSTLQPTHTPSAERGSHPARRRLSPGRRLANPLPTRQQRAASDPLTITPDTLRILQAAATESAQRHLDSYYTAADIAAILGVADVRTVYARERRGEIPASNRIGRLRKWPVLVWRAWQIFKTVHPTATAAHFSRAIERGDPAVSQWIRLITYTG